MPKSKVVVLTDEQRNTFFEAWEHCREKWPTEITKAMCDVLERRWRVCPRIGCRSAFFVVTGHAKYCSGKCSQVAEQETKLKWWNANQKGKPRK